MQGKDELLAITQISVAIIGFSGIVVSLKDRSKLDSGGRMFLELMLQMGVLVFLSSFLPLALQHYSINKETIYRISNIYLPISVVLSFALYVISYSKYYNKRFSLSNISNLDRFFLPIIFIIFIFFTYNALFQVCVDLSVYISLLILQILTILIYFISFINS